jgi:aminopeptidase N
LNLLEPEWDPKDASQGAKLVIKQSARTTDHPTLRFHKIKVAFFLESCEVDVIEVLVRPQPQTAVIYDGSRQYKAILLNYEDHAFAKIALDTISLEFFRNRLGSVKDLLSRALIWNIFYQMVRDAQIKTHTFVEMVTSFLAG